jgi:hypothetical protein
MCLGIPFSMAALTGSSLGEMLLQSLGKMGSVLSFVY